MECASPAADRADKPRHGAIGSRHVKGLKKLCRRPGASLILAGLEECGEGRAVDFREDTHFAFEACVCSGIGAMEYLQRSSAIAIILYGAIHLAGAAASNEGNDPPTTDNGAIGQRGTAFNRNMLFEPFLG